MGTFGLVGKWGRLHSVEPEDEREELGMRVINGLGRFTVEDLLEQMRERLGRGPQSWAKPAQNLLNSLHLVRAGLCSDPGASR